MLNGAFLEVYASRGATELASLKDVTVRALAVHSKQETAYSGVFLFCFGFFLHITVRCMNPEFRPKEHVTLRDVNTTTSTLVKCVNSILTSVKRVKC